ncbi:hypothetical protein MTX78_09190 [Hymenobacter tibetensis]|uniref:Uncharacterized protein n=1 Tax=Hymenobacter tibetensis TaxID=497967 RepID=A0ABY4D2J2_9BACT|nr:hypothetical protein [Hymenobacter tibetensis]UOG76759.1 hypothetical protein MTX78_09190 [Hymenobacter tibetensis]
MRNSKKNAKWESLVGCPAQNFKTIGFANSRREAEKMSKQALKELADNNELSACGATYCDIVVRDRDGFLSIRYA